MKIRSSQDFYSGLMFASVGVAFAIGAEDLQIGSSARMGPGYFPLMLSALMVVLGATLMAKAVTFSRTSPSLMGSWAWRPLLWVIGANLAFGVMLAGVRAIHLPPLGLVAAIYALTIIASGAREHFRWREVLPLATVLAAGSYLTFIVLLKLPIAAWPTFVTN